MVKVILFDFWGTLVEQGVWSPIKQVQHILRINAPFSEYVVRMEKAMMTQEFPTLSEAFEHMCAEFEIQPTSKELELLIGLWNKNWMLAKPYLETISVLNALHEKYIVVLVSNTDNVSINKVLDKYQLRELFHHIFLSPDMHLIKTDPQFLKIVVEQMGVGVDDCVMVGDSIHSDITPAQEQGMKAILVDRKNAREFEPKISNLRELEGKLESWQ